MDRDATPYTDGVSILPAAMERVLLTGRAGSGPSIHLRSLDEWQRAWQQWRDLVLPKAIKHFPGRRPLACYVCGEIEPRPLWGDPPLNNRWLRLYVPADNGCGQWHHDYPEPWQESETAYLWRTGVIDARELRRARKANCLAATSDYPWHQGAFV